MSLKNNLRTVTPRCVWQTLGFIQRLPGYWKLDRSEDLRILRGAEGLPLFITPEVFVLIPENITAYIHWRSQAIEYPLFATETKDFLELAAGCSRFIDIGAQTGFMSALFARSRSGPIQILSIEPDTQVHMILARARELNLASTIDWAISHIAISDVDGSFSLPITNQLYESLENNSEDTFLSVSSNTLTSLIKNINWHPDIIKIDVESYEYEILLSSIAYFESHKPALQLELHWKQISERGFDPTDFLTALSDIGYRGIRKHYRAYDNWIKVMKKEAISRISMRC